MNFGLELSNEFQKFTNGIFESEVQLFTKLQDAFISIASRNRFRGAIDVIHGAKSFVNFELNASYISTLPIGSEWKRELADMLFIVFSTQKTPEIRLMYMQNKKGANHSKFVADLLQLHLLKDRKEITSNPLPKCVFGNPKILSAAVLASVGSYGVFYQDDCKKIEMAYYPAGNLEPCNLKGGELRTVCFNKDIQFGSKCTIQRYVENQGEQTLENFVNALVRMEVGTPILKDPAIHKLVQFLYSNSSVFRESYSLLELEIEPEQDFWEDMPFTCVINADLMSEMD